MRNASTTLKNFLPTCATIWIADLYTITFVNGAVIRLTSAESSLTISGITYNGYGPFIKRSKIVWKAGLETNNVDVDIFALPSHQVGGIPYVQLFVQGMADTAVVQIDRVIGSKPFDTSMGTINLFTGTIGEVKELGRSKISFVVNSAHELLNIPAPQHVYQAGCRHLLFDDNCTLSQAAYTVASTVQTGSTVQKIVTTLAQAGSIAPPTVAPTLSAVNPVNTTALAARTYYALYTWVTSTGETVASPVSSIDIPDGKVLKVTSPAGATNVTGWNVYVATSPSGCARQNDTTISIGTDYTEPDTGIGLGSYPPIAATDGYFAQGMITFTSGINNGLSRLILTFDGGVMTLLPLLPNTPGVGDSFTAIPGCDKMMSTCSQKFSNLINFGGFPYVPQPEVGI